jgi:hypothetical protein
MEGFADAFGMLSHIEDSNQKGPIRYDFVADGKRKPF